MMKYKNNWQNQNREEEIKREDHVSSFIEIISIRKETHYAIPL